MKKNFHKFFGVSILPALLVMPAMAEYTWNHPDTESYSEINGVSHKATQTEDGYNVITGTSMRNTVNGNVELVLDGAKQVGIDEINGVHGNAFFSGSHIATLEDMVVPTDTQKTKQQYVNGDVSVTVKNGSVIDRNVIGNQFYMKSTAETVDDIGLSGKTSVTVKNSTVKGDVRGANIGDLSTAADALAAELGYLKVHDIELNIDNSVVEDEVVSIGAYIPSAGDVKINVKGDSTVGYEADGTTPAKEQDKKGTPVADGWIIAGAQRGGSFVGNTEINLDTAGTIKIAGDVNAGSRERDSENTDADSVRGNATLNMFGGGKVVIGRDVRAYHVAGERTLNLNDIDVTAKNVKEFQTINMDENAKLTVVDTLSLTGADTLNVVLHDADKYSKLIVHDLKANGAALNMTVRNAGTYDVVSADTTTSDFTWNLKNAVFDLSRAENTGTVVATVKAAEKIAEDTGLEKESAVAVSHIAKAESKPLQELSLKLQEKLADPAAKAEVEHATKAIHPETESVAQSVSSSVQNTVVSLASSRMAAPSVGRNGGDVELTAGGVWAQGLFNKSKQNDAFSGYTRGIAVGMDGTLNKHWTVGAGYSYAHSDIDGTARNTEIDSNTVFLYGQYKPAAWYLNAIANYTWSDYSEKGTVIDDALVFADYNVSSFGGALNAGYDFDNGITPELGLRYMHVNANDYANSYGIKTHVDGSDYLTGVLGAKYAFTIAATKHATFMPQLNAGVKYDLLSDKNVATVTMPGVDAYSLEGNRLNRVGGEFGIGLGMQYDSLNVSVNYDIDVRKDYTSQTGMLKLRYNF